VEVSNFGAADNLDGGLMKNVLKKRSCWDQTVMRRPPDRKLKYRDPSRSTVKDRGETVLRRGVRSISFSTNAENIWKRFHESGGFVGRSSVMI
jgi:hypothetical protein